MFPGTAGTPASTDDPFGRVGLGYRPPPPPPTSVFGNPATFTAAANTQAGDYDRIMKSYSDLARSFASNPLTATPVSSTSITPQITPYRQSSDVTGSLSNLSNLATSGGYSSGDIQNIRARSISPIRSVYANAQREVERQRALSGGYSPNFGAVQAQMARDEAQQIGDIGTNVEAGIAQNVAGNKISIAPSFSSAAGAANQTQLAADTGNTEAINRINALNEQNRLQAGEFNTQAQLEAQRQNRANLVAPLQGQTSLYGTTPALTSTFGNQVAQAAQIGQNQQQINQRRNTDMWGMPFRYNG